MSLTKNHPEYRVVMDDCLQVLRTYQKEIRYPWHYDEHLSEFFSLRAIIM